MEQQPQDLRNQTLELIKRSAADQPELVQALTLTWLTSLDEDDLQGIAPGSLAEVLRAGFAQTLLRAGKTCQVHSLSYADGRGGKASALLIQNDDMPYLVDSLVMALRKSRLSVNAVLNAVLGVTRDASGQLTAVSHVKDSHGPRESYVLVLLAETAAAEMLHTVSAQIRMVAQDAAVVQRDAAKIKELMEGIGQDVKSRGAEGFEVAEFLQWAQSEGFEAFGYAYYRVVAGARELERDLPSRIGVLQDTSHPVYGACLANIPGDYESLAARKDILSVVKADVQCTLHRDQRLDFIGVRDTDSAGKIIGEHCFVGLFTRVATNTAVAKLPVARLRVAKVLELAGVRKEGFRAEKFREILDSLPRTETMEADPQWLAEVCSAIVSMYKLPRTKVFARRDVYARHLNVLVYLPRERYSANLAEAVAAALKESSGASDVRWQTLVADGPLARLYLIANAARYPLDLASDIQQPLLKVMDGWHGEFEQLIEALPDANLRSRLRQDAAALPAAYINVTPPAVALRDLQAALAQGDREEAAVRIEVAAGEKATIRLHSVNSVPSLSNILPALHNAGVEIDREHSYQISGNGMLRRYVTSLQLDAPSAAKLAKLEDKSVAEDLFAQLFNNHAEDGRLNGLVVEGGLRTREVQMIRAYLGYWRQAGSRFSVRYMADCLRRQPGYVKRLVDAFMQRFDPAADDAARAAGNATIASLKSNLADVDHADTEEILGIIAELMLATLRTNYFQNDGDTIIFKFDCGALGWLPEPRPYREIYVFSRRFEGVHLRGGPVARGGLRWSDRMEDYRTEVLGLVKAQMVKNAVIVPAGAKGGFVCKMMPQNAAREVIAAEGEAVYRLFIGGLLDITDNRQKGEVVHPANTVCHDGNDPYLVVAADKGTATFSDIANGIAVSRGFWLGDAFASGGSNGYDHKKLGITAKGAFEAVKRHFYEIGHDMNTTPTTVVGVGDMSGDVFGNGVLLSRNLKLLAAFDHRHIFLDPNPDCAVSFAERERMFALPRSSWDDYNKELISKGGGVYPRTVRSIDLSDEIRAALDIAETALTPEELMHRILLAPVDLFYNGGIGTYIKASHETHAQVKDRANDNIRVSGRELRCKVVAEGGNLGATQSGRIEFALHGGHIFTDAIDNSAGVDCSDHEVNAKIWLDAEVNAGKLGEAERNTLLNEMTAEIERLVLRDNSLQTHLLVREEQAQADGMVLDAYAALIADLEAEGALSRELEQLPNAVELARRKSEGIGLTTPELAVVVAHVKNRFKRILAEQDLTSADWAATLLAPYFPAQMVAARDPLEHPLANAILATVLANEVVNRCGPLMVAQLAAQYQVSQPHVVIAWAQAWAALNLAPLYDALDADALNVPRQVSMDVHERSRQLQKGMVEGVLALQQSTSDSSALSQLSQLFGEQELLNRLIGSGAAWPALDGVAQAYAHAALALDALSGVAGFLFASLSVKRPADMDLAQFLRVGMELRSASGIAQIERGLKQGAEGESQSQLRDFAQQALRRAQQRLLNHVLQSGKMEDQDIAAMVQNLGLAAPQFGADLAQVMLQAWALSEAANRVAEAA
ncbi:NAD-glutamate dehydrogenase domain-containing protein [Massilia sp. W12]|uniref:NAD-glutamate dehydrogenase domain-containing protein n=1 Tax=Massilia sp. W12 TaxID=3126507 RepID=UPI0030D4CAD3